jgi:hypothetical protein
VILETVFQFKIVLILSHLLPANEFEGTQNDGDVNQIRCAYGFWRLEALRLWLRCSASGRRVGRSSSFCRRDPCCSRQAVEIDAMEIRAVSGDFRGLLLYFGCGDSRGALSVTVSVFETVGAANGGSLKAFRMTVRRGTFISRN